MPRRPTEGPTPTQLEILHILWRSGPSTVRHVHENLGRGTGYTTTLKLLQIMLEKGMVRRDDTSRSHVYKAAVSQKHVQRQVVRNILKCPFDGSALRLVECVLRSRRLSADDMVQLRRLVDEIPSKPPGRGASR